MAGADPVLVDVCPSTWTVSPEVFSSALRETGARAAVVLQPFGLHTDLSAHARIAQGRGAMLVIDNAAGLGVARDNPEKDPWVYEAYSLHATKPFGIGEGGVVFAHRTTETGLRRAFNFGLPAAENGAPPHWGINGKMSEFQAAIGLAMAEIFATQLACRRRVAAGYAALMRDFPEVQCRTSPEDGAWQFFPLLLPTGGAADRFTLETRRRNMEICRYYAPSLSQCTDARQLHACPVAEDLAARMCCLPVYPDATEQEVGEMVAIVEACLRASTGACWHN
jgi:dTDP-4-amino-4,6-dideoxygalactose transaminase